MVRKRSWGTHARWFISSSWVFNVLSAGLAISWNNSLFIQWVNKSVWNQGCCLFILEGGGGIKSEGGEREDELGKRKSSLTNNIEQNWALKVKGSRLLLLGVCVFFFFLGGGGGVNGGWGRGEAGGANSNWCRIYGAPAPRRGGRQMEREHCLPKWSLEFNWKQLSVGPWGEEAGASGGSITFPARPSPSWSLRPRPPPPQSHPHPLWAGQLFTSALRVCVAPSTGGGWLWTGGNVLCKSAELSFLRFGGKCSFFGFLPVCPSVCASIVSSYSFLCPFLFSVVFADRCPRLVCSRIICPKPWFGFLIMV